MYRVSAFTGILGLDHHQYSVDGCRMCTSKLGWACPQRGTKHDLDRNAAINLENCTVSSTVSACGAEVTGLGHKIRKKPAPVKQKVRLNLIRQV